MKHLQAIDKASAVAELDALREQLRALKAREIAESNLCSAQAQHARYAARRVIGHLRNMLEGVVASKREIGKAYSQASVDMLVSGGDAWMLQMLARLGVVQAYRPYAVREIKRQWQRRQAT